MPWGGDQALVAFLGRLAENSRAQRPRVWSTRAACGIWVETTLWPCGFLFYREWQSRV